MKKFTLSLLGAAMHNLAIDLHNNGYLVTGSDDEIYEPSRSLLAACGLLPAEIGWFLRRFQKIWIV
jgi:UDP-N-acetylmuramate: L-alanyl-gamma-D-glutamyl-meso-diaminopimelate ligase